MTPAVAAVVAAGGDTLPRGGGTAGSPRHGGRTSLAVRRPSSCGGGARTCRPLLPRRPRRAHGFEIWNNLWFGGHHTLGYGALFPVLGAAFGIWTVAVASAAARRSSPTC